MTDRVPWLGGAIKLRAKTMRPERSTGLVDLYCWPVFFSGPTTE